jgi:transcriptional regulator with XRE-family HTH domain
MDAWVPADTFAVRLRMLRSHMGVTLEELAGRCRVSPTTWSTWERGSRPRRQAISGLTGTRAA